MYLTATPLRTVRRASAAPTTAPRSPPGWLAYWAIARNLVFGRPTEPDDVDGEPDIDPDDWSPCFYAAIAEADPVWMEDSDPEKRRTFWRWYLLEAVPAVT